MKKAVIALLALCISLVAALALIAAEEAGLQTRKRISSGLRLRFPKA